MAYLYINAITYIHPVLGEKITTSIADLTTEAVEKSLKVLTTLEQGEAIGCGRSLETGLINSSVSDMKHFFQYH